MLYEIDSIREIFIGSEKIQQLAMATMASQISTSEATEAEKGERIQQQGIVDEGHMLEIIKRMNRIVMILKVWSIGRVFVYVST